MCKLREVTDCRRVTKVVVVTDSPGPLAPGKIVPRTVDMEEVER